MPSIAPVHRVHRGNRISASPSPSRSCRIPGQRDARPAARCARAARRRKADRPDASGFRAGWIHPLHRCELAVGWPERSPPTRSAFEDRPLRAEAGSGAPQSRKNAPCVAGRRCPSRSDCDATRLDQLTTPAAAAPSTPSGPTRPVQYLGPARRRCKPRCPAAPLMNLAPTSHPLPSDGEGARRAGEGVSPSFHGHPRRHPPRPGFHGSPPPSTTSPTSNSAATPQLVVAAITAPTTLKGAPHSWPDFPGPDGLRHLLLRAPASR